MQLRHNQKLPETSGMQNWGSIANLMGLSYDALMISGCSQGLDEAFWKQTVRDALRQGKAVMAGFGHHVVRIEAICDHDLQLSTDSNDAIGEHLAGTTAAESVDAGQKHHQTIHLGYDKLQNAGLQWVMSLFSL